MELEAVIGNPDRVGSPMPFAWLVLSGALAAALAPISGPFVATELFWSRLPAAVRPCGSAAELIGRRVKLFGLGRIGITRNAAPGDGLRPYYGQQRPHRFENVPSLRPSLLAARLSSASVIAHTLR